MIKKLKNFVSFGVNGLSFVVLRMDEFVNRWCGILFRRRIDIIY